MSRCQRECHRFEPDILLQKADVAQSVAHLHGKQKVPSSILGISTTSNMSPGSGSSPLLDDRNCPRVFYFTCANLTALKSRIYIQPMSNSQGLTLSLALAGAR